MFLEEAENERMHLLTALVLRKPGPIFKFLVITAQGDYASHDGHMIMSCSRSVCDIILDCIYD